MQKADDTYRGINARIVERRQKWETARQESPDTTCGVYHNECKTVLSVGLSNKCSCAECTGIEKPATTWMGKSTPEVCTKFSCRCIEKARRQQERGRHTERRQAGRQQVRTSTVEAGAGDDIRELQGQSRLA